jgi:MFS family permease
MQLAWVVLTRQRMQGLPGCAPWVRDENYKVSRRGYDSMIAPAAATPLKGLSPAFITLFLLATGMTTLSVAGTAPILPMLQAFFADVDNAATLSRATMTVGSIGIVVGAPLTAFAAGLFGRKALLIGAACLFTLAGSCGYFVDSLAVIVASRFVVGMTAALLTTLTVTIVAEAYDEVGRNRWMGVMVGTGTFLAMVLLPLAGALGDLGWRQCFLLHLIGVPVAVLAWLGYRETAPAADAVASVSARAPIRFDLIALGLCAGTAINAQSIYAPFKLDSIGVHSATLIGLSMMPLTLLAAIVSPFYGKLRTFASAAWVFAVGFAGLACGLTVFVLAANLPLALCGYALFGAGMGLVIANLYAVGAQSDNPDHRGSGLGQALAAYYAAPLVTQVLLEPLTDGQPIRALAWLASFCALMCVSWLAFSVRSYSRARPRTA